MTNEIVFLGNLESDSSIGKQNLSIVEHGLSHNVHFLPISHLSFFEDKNLDYLANACCIVTEVSNRPDNLFGTLLLGYKPTQLILHDLWLTELVLNPLNVDEQIQLLFKEFTIKNSVLTHNKAYADFLRSLGWHGEEMASMALELIARFTLFSLAMVTHSHWAKASLMSIESFLKPEWKKHFFPKINVIELPEIPASNLSRVQYSEVQLLQKFEWGRSIGVLGHQNSIKEIQIIVNSFAKISRKFTDANLYFVGVITPEIRKFLMGSDLFSKRIFLIEAPSGEVYKAAVNRIQHFIHLRTKVTEASSGTFSDILSTGRSAIVLPTGSRNDYRTLANLNFIDKLEVNTLAVALEKIISNNHPTCEPYKRIELKTYGQYVASCISSQHNEKDLTLWSNKVRAGYLLGVL